MTTNDLNRVRDEFAMAALRVKEIGFDAIELHMGHGYLLSQFLSPATNKRKDKYGGTIENRSRFPLRWIVARFFFRCKIVVIDGEPLLFKFYSSRVMSCIHTSRHMMDTTNQIEFNAFVFPNS